MSTGVAVPKFTASLELLSRGIELYLRGDSYYSALHLAGAAEEIFAVYVRELPPEPLSGVGSASDQIKQAFVALSDPVCPQDKKSLEKWFHDRTYAAKNAVKHKRGHRDYGVDFDPKLEAAELLDLAISTYFQLFSRMGLPYLPCIEAFDKQRRVERAEDEV
jgi:hypothetical protein